ncbi:unnamed protein product [Moneuplotes crassus]|uniref:EamA domain-containing protein n=1 Tax=Euplotes crassus TaxID=5936 RepID=A0AAD1XBG5_EUPCR|nr:unnamed protein product [Moneuplotes crassus]
MYRLLSEEGLEEALQEENDVDKTEKEANNLKQVEKNQFLSVVYAAFCGVMFSFTNYIYGHFSTSGTVTRETFAFGTLVFAVGYYFVEFIHFKRQGKKYLTWQDSNFRNPETGKFCWKRFSAIFLYSAIILVSGYFLLYTFQFGTYGNMNHGILTSLFGLSAIFSAVLAYFLFGDRLKIFHVIGIILMLICIVGLSLGSTKNSEIELLDETAAEISDTPLFYALLSIALGIICPISFAGSGMVVRYASNNYGTKSLQLTLIGFLWYNIVLFPALLITYLGGYQPFIASDFLLNTFCGILGAFSIIVLNKALTLGLAGPVFALANLQIIIQSILDAIFLSQVPTWIEIVAAVFGILGCCTIALGPDLAKKFKSNHEKYQASDSKDI